MSEKQAFEYINPSEIEKTNNNKLVTIDESILLLWNSMEYEADQSSHSTERALEKHGLLMT